MNELDLIFDDVPSLSEQEWEEFFAGEWIPEE